MAALALAANASNGSSSPSSFGAANASNGSNTAGGANASGAGGVSNGSNVTDDSNASVVNSGPNGSNATGDTNASIADGGPNGSNATDGSNSSHGSSNASTAPGGFNTSGPRNASEHPNASDAFTGPSPATGVAAQPCSVSAPDNGGLGDCPRSLPSGATCRPSCSTGYNASGLATCVSGNVSTVLCLPSGCDLGAVPGPENGRHGPQCASLQVLESGQTCDPLCNANWSMSSPSSCSFGVLTPGRCVQCGPGQTFNDTLRGCQDCPAGTYKAVGGNDPCSPCPAGSDTDGRAGASSWTECLCNASTYRTSGAASGGGGPFACAPCPENAQIKGVVDGRLREGTSVQDCKCIDPFPKQVRNASRGNELLRCRAERPCALREWLHTANLTGPQHWRLRLGSCAAFINDSGIPSGQDCLLECPDRSAPQVKADLLSAPNRQILCEDGVIVQHPPPGTWCSEASWKLPPIVFLVAVTLAAGLAMFNIERRQQSFEQSCSRALANGIPQGPGGLWNSVKSKVA